MKENNKWIEATAESNPKKLWGKITIAFPHPKNLTMRAKMKDVNY